MERYRAHLSKLDVEPAKRDEMIHALRMILTVIVDIFWNTSDIQLIERINLKDSFEQSVSNAKAIVAVGSEITPPTPKSSTVKQENKEANHGIARTSSGRHLLPR